MTTAMWRDRHGRDHNHTPGQCCTQICGTAPREWTLDLPITIPLSLNDRTERHARAKEIAVIRNGMHAIIRHAKIPALYRVTIELHYAPRDKRRRDPINYVPTLKPCEDAFVDAGVIIDDDQDHHTSVMPLIDPPAGRGSRVYLIVREIQGPT